MELLEAEARAVTFIDIKFSRVKRVREFTLISHIFPFLTFCFVHLVRRMRFRFGSAAFKLTLCLPLNTWPFQTWSQWWATGLLWKRLFNLDTRPLLFRFRVTIWYILWPFPLQIITKWKQCNKIINNNFNPVILILSTQGFFQSILLVYLIISYHKATKPLNPVSH